MSRVIGRGGMGVVYLAQDTKLGRNLALKLLRPEYTHDEERLRRFKQEARAASALNHPNVLTVHELGEVEGIHFIAAEFVEGTTLRDRILGQEMKLTDVVEVTLQVANALGVAHRAGIIHRDIKPENIMLRPDGIVKVLDFGVAKLVETKGVPAESDWMTAPYVETTKSVSIGTPRYMSPEQTRGFALDGRTDIFSLGAVMYEITTGHSPFVGETSEDLKASILKDDPLPISHYTPEAPQQLQEIVTKALRKNKEERYQKAEELAVELTRLKGELSRLNLELSDSMPAKITENYITEIRRHLLSARSIAELRMNLFRIEEFLSEHPGHAEARMLKNQIEEAILVEKAEASTLSRQPEAMKASATFLSRFLRHLTPIILVTGVAVLSSFLILVSPSAGAQQGSGLVAIIEIGLLAIAAYILIKYRFVLKIFGRSEQADSTNSHTPIGLREVALVGLAAGTIILGSYALYLTITKRIELVRLEKTPERTTPTNEENKSLAPKPRIFSTKSMPQLGVTEARAVMAYRDGSVSYWIDFTPAPRGWKKRLPSSVTFYDALGTAVLEDPIIPRKVRLEDDYARIDGTAQCGLDAFNQINQWRLNK